MSHKELFYDVLGMHVLALWILAEEIQPEDPQSLATRILRKSAGIYYKMPPKELDAIAERLAPKNWPPDESV